MRMARLGSVLLGYVFWLAASGAAQSIDPLTVDGVAQVTGWVQPVYPEALRRERIEGEVVAHLVVEADGTQRDLQIASSSDERFSAAVRDALAQWTFQPAIFQGRPVATGVGIRWKFVLPYPKPGQTPPMEAWPQPLPHTPAVAEYVPDPRYPDSLLPRRLDGEVLCEATISHEGTVEGVRVLQASHGDFVTAAVAALRSWRFKPATQGSLAVRDTKVVPLTFEYDATLANDGVTPLAANGFSFDLPEGATASQVCDQPPRILATVEPVYPLDLLEGTQDAEAEVSFVLPITGIPREIRIEHATHPAAGAAVAASVRTTVFAPAIKDGSAIEVRLQRNHCYRLPGGEPEPGEGHAARLLRQVKAGQTVLSSKGLDRKLAPLWRVAPAYPLELADNPVVGTAEIELIIDPDGRARLPRVVSASHEAFGWAAATALSQWVFEKPTRGGTPADVRVRVPVSFAPPN